MKENFNVVNIDKVDSISKDVVTQPNIVNHITNDTTQSTLDEVNSLFENELIKQHGNYVSVHTYGRGKKTVGGNIVLSNKDMYSIIKKYQDDCVYKNLHEARKVMENHGYTIHVLYVKYGPKMPLPEYDPKCFGVRIRDDDFDYDNHEPSKDATIIEIIDVGGIDINDHGMIKL